MSRVVTMLVPQQAAEAQVIVLAVVATNQVGFIGFCVRLLAGTSKTSKKSEIHTTATSIANGLVVSLSSHV